MDPTLGYNDVIYAMDRRGRLVYFNLFMNNRLDCVETKFYYFEFDKDTWEKKHE